MIKYRFLCKAILLAGAALLSACGGSSGPAATSPPPPPPPVVVVPSVTVTGYVTDMPIPNATVIITVNGQQFTAPNPTAADGSFSVDIESDDPEAMVICEAFDPNGPARFSALLNNFAGMQASAGADNVADDVNITNITTAQFLLAQELAADGSIDDLDELQTISEQIDPAELLELAAAIKLVIDSVAGVALPDGFADVQELAAAIVDGTSTFLADVELVNPGILEQTINDVVSDGFATATFDADGVPGVYIDAVGNDLMVLYEDGSGYSAEQEILVDGQGNVFENQLIEAVSWTITASGDLQIVFVEAQDVDTVTLVNDAGGVLTLYVNELDGLTGTQESNSFNVFRFGFDPNGFAAASVPGSYYDPDDVEEATEFTVFLADGSGYDIDALDGVQGEFFTWAVDATGELFLTDDGLIDIGDFELNDDREAVRLLDGSTANLLNLLVVEMPLEGDTVVRIEAFPVTYTSEIIAGPTPDMANTVLLEGKTYAFFEGNETGLVTFGANGVFSEVYQDFDAQFGPEWDEGDGEWFVDDQGTIHITFVESDGTAQTDRATVVTGLGADTMLVLTDDDGVSNELVLTRVVPFEATEVVGTWQDLDPNLTTVLTAAFNADGSGSYAADGIVDENFQWSVNAAGTLVSALQDVTGAPDGWTDNFHKLADSTADVLHLVVVFRIDGVLVNDADDPTGPPEAILELNISRLSN